MMQQPVPAGGAVGGAAPGGSSDTKALMDKFAAFVSRHRTEKQLSKQRLEEVTRNIQVLQDRVSQDPEDGRALPTASSTHASGAPPNHHQHQQHQQQHQPQQQQYVGQHSQPQHHSGGGRSHLLPGGGGHVINQQVNTTGEQPSTVDTVEGMTTGSRESQMAQVVSETPVTTDSLRGGGSSAAASSHGVLASVSVSQGPRSVTSAGFHSVGGGGGGTAGSNGMNITGAIPPHMGGGVMGGVGGGGGSAGTWDADATISAMHETSAGSAVHPTSNDTGNIPVQAPSPYHVARRGAGGETGAAHRTTPAAASGANIASVDVAGDLPPHQAHHQQQYQQQGYQHPAGSLPPPEVPPLPLGQRGVSSSNRGVGAGAGAGHGSGGGVGGNPIEAFAANADYSAMSPHKSALGSAMASHNASAVHAAGGAAMPHPEAMAPNAPPGSSAQQAAGAPFHTSGAAAAAGDGNLLPMNAAQPLQGHQQQQHQAADPHSHPPQQQHQAAPGLVALMSHGGTASIGVQGQSHHSANNREGPAVAPGAGISGPGVVQGHAGGGAPHHHQHHQLAPNVHPGVGGAGAALVPLGGDVHGQDHGHGIVAAPSYTDSHFSEYVAKLQAQTDAAEKKATMLAKTLVKTLRQRTELEECAGRMSSEVEEIRVTMAGLQSARVDRDEAIAELDAMRDVAARRTAAVERAEAVARQAATALEQHVKDERDARRQQQRDKETMLTQVTQQLSDVVAERDELKQELFEMQQECTNASDELAAQVEHNQDLHDRVTHLESELKAERVRRLTTERQVLTAPAVLLPNANAVPSAAAHPGGGDGNPNPLRTASGRYASPIDVEAERDSATSTQQMRQQRKRIGGVASPDARDPQLATVAPGDATATDDDDANAAMDRRSEMTAAMAAIRAAGGVDAQIAALEARHRDILTTLTTEHEADVSRKSARIDSLQSQTAELRRRVKDLEHTLSTTKRDAAVASRNATTHSFAAQMARQRLFAVKQDALRVQQVLTTSRADASAIYDEAEEDGNDTVRLFVDRVAQDLANVSHFLVRLRMMEVEAAPIVAPPPSLPVPDSQQTGAAATGSESRGQNSRHGSGGVGRRGGGHGGGGGDGSLAATSLGSKKKNVEEERRSALARSSKSRTQSSSIPPHASDSPTEDSTSDGSQSAIAAHTDTSTTTPTRRGGGGKHNYSSSRHSDPSGLTHTPLKADGKLGRKLRGPTEHDDTNDTILPRPSSLTRHDPPHTSSEPRATYRSVSGGASRRAPPPPPPPPSPPKRSETSSPQRMTALDEVAAVLRSDPAHAPRPASPAHLTAVAVATARTVSPTSVSSVRTAETSHLSRGGLSRGGLAKAVFSGTTSERSGSRGTASYPGLFETSPTRINVDGTPTDNALNAPQQADTALSTRSDDAAEGGRPAAAEGVGAAGEEGPLLSRERPTTAAAKRDGSKRKMLQSPSEEPSLSAPPTNDVNENSKPEDSKAALAQVAAVLASDPSARRTPTTPSSLPPAGDNAAMNDAHRRTQQPSQREVVSGRVGGGRAAPPAPSFDDDDDENDTPPSSPLPPADARTATVAPHMGIGGGDDPAMVDRRAGQQQQQEGSMSHRTSPLFGGDGIGAPRSDLRQQDRTVDDIRHSSSSHGQAEEEGLVHTEDIMTRTAEPDMDDDDDDDEDEVTDRFNDDQVRYDPHNHHDHALQGGGEELEEGEESAGGFGYEGFAAANAPIDLPTPTGSES